MAFTKPEAKSAFVLRAGQFKRYFGRYEQTSTSNLPSIERGTGRGLVPVASNDIAVLSGYMSLDIGAGLMFTGLNKRLLIEGAVMNGRGQNIDGQQQRKSLYARADVRRDTEALARRLLRRATRAFAAGSAPVDSSASNNGFGLDGSGAPPARPASMSSSTTTTARPCSTATTTCTAFRSSRPTTSG